ncbi:MAG: sugar phosphate isomerase/epimerase family protein [Armatimonadota bacterium]
MFKLSVISDEISQDFERVLQVCQEYDVPMVEPRSVWDKAPQELSDSDLTKMKKLLDEYDMGVCSIASPFLKCDLGDEKQYQEHLDILRRCIHMAHVFECKIIRGFTFWRTGPPEDVWQQLLDAYEEPIKICEREDVYIGIENEASTHIGSAAEAEKLYNDLASPRVRAIWDPANEVFAEGGELPYPDAFERMKSYLIHVHIKDAVKTDKPEKGKCVPVGEGGYIDYPGQFQALIDMGYEGACSLETHWRPEEELDRDLLDEPGGASFSATGEPASRICLDNIMEIMSGLDY